jgi:zinc transport system permease protein
VSVFGGVLLVALAVAASTSALSQRGFGVDTVLGVLAHSALALGLVAVSLLDGVRVDLMAYLFGDILAVSTGDLAVIWGGGAVIVGLVVWRWSALLTATLNPDLARAAGIDPVREERLLMLALVLAVTVSIKVVGALLIGAMLLIPAATARSFARTPEAMAAIAAAVGATSALAGLWVAFLMDTPTGPTIVSVAAALFAVSTLARVVRPAR